ncbi:MAG: folate family ECF transporter S component [Lachnospiraceae bacterium]|nr:folate family ECF transporter S component [Lachnospiraceae bacterium]
MRQEMNGAAHRRVQGGFRNWKDSVLVFHNVRAVVVAGMLLALHIILAMVLGIYLTQTVKFSISFITNVVTGYLFGPWMALITGALGDILQFVIKPVGGYFFGWTFNAAIGGLMYGLAFYRRAPKERNMDVVKAGNQKEKADTRMMDYVCMGVFAAMLAVWFLLPFLDVTVKAADSTEGGTVYTGTAFLYMAKKVGDGVGTSPETLALVALVLMAAGAVCSLCRRRVPVILLGVVACLWMLLPAYNERSVLSVRQGFILLCIGFAVVVLLNLLAVMRAKSMDVGYLLRCFLTMLFVALVVQMFLGTVWCVMIYGKGFWFYFVPRAIKSLIQLPFNTILSYYVIRALRDLRVAEIVN